MNNDKENEFKELISRAADMYADAIEPKFDLTGKSFENINAAQERTYKRLQDRLSIHRNHPYARVKRIIPVAAACAAMIVFAVGVIPFGMQKAEALRRFVGKTTYTVSDDGKTLNIRTDNVPADDSTHDSYVVQGEYSDPSESRKVFKYSDIVNFRQISDMVIIDRNDLSLYSFFDEKDSIVINYNNNAKAIKLTEQIVSENGEAEGMIYSDTAESCTVMGTAGTLTSIDEISFLVSWSLNGIEYELQSYFYTKEEVLEMLGSLKYYEEG